MSKDEVKSDNTMSSSTSSVMSLDNDDTQITILTQDSIIKKEFYDFYNNIKYNISIDDEKDEKIIRGKFVVSKSKLMEFSNYFKSMLESNQDDTVLDLTQTNSVNAECTSWIIAYMNIYNSKNEYVMAKKPAELELKEGFKNEKDLQYFTTLNDNILLLVELIKQCNYMDIPILLHNASYTFASYIKRTDPETIVKTLKRVGLIPENEIFNNDDCEDCDDDPLPLDKINPK